MTNPTPSRELGLSTELANIDIYPTTISKQPPGATCTVGDMHGNAKKLLWILIREGAINMKKEYFDRMVVLYNKMYLPTLTSTSAEDEWGPPPDPSAIWQKLFDEFNEILAEITVKNPNFNLRLIGDLFADRGSNDYLTLMVLKKLHDGGIIPEIIYSNHDALLLNNYDKPPSEWKSLPDKTQQSSMDGLGKLTGVLSIKVTDLVQKQVLPHLKLISYDLSKDGKEIDVFMHAPNNFDAIMKLANAFGIHYQKPKSALEFAVLIDEINEKWAKFKEEKLYDYPDPKNPQWPAGSLKALLEQFIWNRPNGQYGARLDTKDFPSFVAHVVHGHNGPLQKDPYTAPDPRQASLDTNLGNRNKDSSEIITDDYNYFISSQTPQDILQALHWVREINTARDNTIDQKVLDRYLVNVINTALSLLQAGIGAQENPENIDESFTAFKTAVNFAQGILHQKRGSSALLDMLSWKNIFNEYLKFIPNFDKYTTAHKGDNKAFLHQFLLSPEKSKKVVQQPLHAESELELHGISFKT